MTKRGKALGVRIIALQWYTPYSEPPAGTPRVLRWGIIPLGMEELTALRKLKDAGPNPKGYVVVWLMDSGETSFRGPEVMQNARLKNLRKRMLKKVPLFADYEIGETVSRKPDYFSIDGCARDLEDKKTQVRRHETLFQQVYSRDRQVDLEEHIKEAE